MVETETAETEDLLARRVRATPDVTALIDAGTGREWTYAELDAAVEETAGRLADVGIAAGDHVGVLMETRPAFVRLVFAAWRLGGVVAPLNVRLAPAELERQREVADLDLVVCEADTEPDALAAAGGTPVRSVDDPSHADVAALRAAAAGPVRAPDRPRDETAALAFTSGTTGDPKAVRLTGTNVRAAATASAYRLGVLPDDRWLCPLSLYHVGGLSVPLRCTRYGTTAVLQRGFDAASALAALDEYDCTGVSLVPTMLRRMLDVDGRGFPASLRFALVGGAAAPRDLIAACERRGVPVHPSYGMTEAASQIATATPTEAFDDPDAVGRPLLGVEVTVVGADGEPAPAGETGDLVVAGPTVTPGYYGDPDATDDAFGPFGFATGDVGYRDEDGRLHVLNRRSDRIVTGGENVHPGEVVEALRAHPAVREAAVVGVADPEWGERVAALVVPDGEATADAIREFCRERLAGFKVPKTVAFVDALPRTASGTVDRSAARERARRAADR